MQLLSAKNSVVTIIASVAATASCVDHLKAGLASYGSDQSQQR